MSTGAKSRSPVLIGGEWRASDASRAFHTTNPETGERLGTYPVSRWAEVDDALARGQQAYDALQEIPEERIADFLNILANEIDGASRELAEIAHAETGLPLRPRLIDIELPRTTDQLRQAASAVRSRSWKRPILSPGSGIASMYVGIPGVVCVLGPNNFPFAFNSAAGGDFAAAVATGHPVIAKANPGHPETTRSLAAHALHATTNAGLPISFVQLIYRTSHEVGAQMVADTRVAATAYTGSRAAGLALKTAADKAGRPIYLEMSSVNPVVVLPGAWHERGDALAHELVSSMLLGGGQFCTSPGLLFVLDSPETAEFILALKDRIEAAPPVTLLGEPVRDSLAATVDRWLKSGASVLAQSDRPSGTLRCAYPNTVLSVRGSEFVDCAVSLQTEAFGNVSLLVVCEGVDELRRCLELLDGNLTGAIFSASDTSEESTYQIAARALRPRVGRLLNDKVPTGVAVVSAMNHGGPYPSTGHPGFTAVGVPTSFTRFGMLQSFDNVRDDRLPPELQAANPLGMARLVEGEWTKRVADECESLE